MTTIGSASVGTRGTLIIDDDGTYIRFYLSQGDGATFIGSPGKSWSGVVNGVGVGGSWTWPSGGGTRLIAGPWAVGYTQNISFSVGATGTQGFGGGGTAYGTAYRATVPAPPIMLQPDEITPTSMRVRFSGQSDGGSPITSWALQRATDPGFTQNVVTVGSSGTTYFTDLTPATTYYYRARGGNAVGAGGWASTVSAMTASGAYASINGVWVPVPINVSNGSAWLALAPLVSDGAAWRGAI